MAKISQVRLQIFPERVRSLTQSRTGPVGFATLTAARNVHDRAQRLIGGPYSGRKPGPRLKDSGHVTSSNPTPNYNVEFIHRAAVVHHEGHKAFTLRKKTRGVYRIVKLSGEVVYRPGPIHIPAVKGNPYLTKAARSLGLRVGFRSARPREVNLIGTLRGTFVRNFS